MFAPPVVLLGLLAVFQAPPPGDWDLLGVTFGGGPIQSGVQDSTRRGSHSLSKGATGLNFARCVDRALLGKVWVLPAPWEAARCGFIQGFLTGALLNGWTSTPSILARDLTAAEFTERHGGRGRCSRLAYRRGSCAPFLWQRPRLGATRKRSSQRSAWRETGPRRLRTRSPR